VSGDVRRVLRAEEGHGGGDFLRPAVAVHRNQA
jgi:hypothetical protein